MARQSKFAPLKALLPAALALASTATMAAVLDPEAGVVSDGTEPTVNPDGTLNVVIDAHAHIAAAAGFGGSFYCGDNIGDMSVALAGCPKFAPGQIGNLVEAIIGGASVTQPQKGYPDFSAWPNVGSLLHEQAYYTSIERLWKSGVGMINLLAVNNDIACEIWEVGQNGDCSDMSNVRKQLEKAKQIEYWIDQHNGGVGQGWFRIVKTPEQARQVIAQGKLAVSLGVEVSGMFGCSGHLDAPACTKDDIDQGLDEMQQAGVSGFFPIHKFDNALGGVRFDSLLTGAILDVGQLLWYGHWWEAQPCQDEAHDNSQIISQDNLARAATIFAQSFSHKTVPAGVTFPVYPEGNICNVRGLTDLGKYTVEEMEKRGMIIHVDHMSVKSARDTLDIVERTGYPGVMSEHSWSDNSIVGRIIRDGGFAASLIYNAADAPDVTDSYINDKTFQGDWEDNNAYAGKAHHTKAYGFSSDTNGWAIYPRTPNDNDRHPVPYPFTAINGAQLDKEHWGTRYFDYNKDQGAITYGMFADWMYDVLQRAGSQEPELKKELLASAEAYVTMWEKSLDWANSHH